MPPSRSRVPFRRLLLTWYRKTRRDLPWRRTRDPYEIWISEVMLQQTQVSTVIPYYERFLARFPTPKDLAEASEDQVMALWTGLGYYSRARNMHRAARAMVERHGGRLPDSHQTLSDLPGIGPYTAAAVASIAFGLPHAVLDGNVARILSRLEALPGDDRTTANRKHLWALAQDLLDTKSAGDFNQAMMELGATVCSPREPNCGVCPVASLCLARQEGDPQNYPRRPAGKKQVRVHWSVARIELDGAFLLVRSASPGLFEGMWELPWADCGPADLPAALEAKYDLRIEPGEKLGVVQHSITHRRISLHAIRAALATGRARETGKQRCWVRADQLGEHGLSSMARKVLEL